MRAAVYRRNGPAAEVLKIETLPDPMPGPGEVRVRVRVSGVNPTDWKARVRGTPPMTADFQIPGQDGAGEIDRVGAGVHPNRVGERVWLLNAAYRRPWGTAAEFSVVPADQAVLLPEHVSYDQGASLGIPAITAHRTLFADGPISGQWVLVAGGAGAVGFNAIALARRAGAQVIATVSSQEKAAIARRAGAEQVVNYREADAADQVMKIAGGQVSRIVEVAPVGNSALDHQVLAQNGTIAIYATDQQEWTIAPTRLYFRNTTLRFTLVYEIPAEARAVAIRDITAALDARQLPTMDFTRFPLDRVAAAHDAVESGAVGKVLIDIA